MTLQQLCGLQSRLPRLTAGLFISGALFAAQAGPIYQCKQADGRVAFQEMPCAATATQAEVGKTTHAAPPPAAKPKAAGTTTPTKTTPATAQAALPTGYAACSQVGTQLFDPARAQHLQHPQAAVTGCRKAVPAEVANDSQCLEACLHAWTREYQKKFVRTSPE